MQRLNEKCEPNWPLDNMGAEQAGSSYVIIPDDRSGYLTMNLQLARATKEEEQQIANLRTFQHKHQLQPDEALRRLKHAAVSGGNIFVSGCKWKRLLAGYGGALHIESQAGIGTETTIQMLRHQQALGLNA